MLIQKSMIIKGEMIMGFLNGFLFYACEFIALVLVATAGIFVGKKLRDRKDAKKSNKTERETTLQ